MYFTAVFYKDALESEPRNRSEIPEISPTVERCHRKPALVLQSLFKPCYWPAEEHHVTRPAYSAEAPLSHTLPALDDICFVSTWVPKQPLFSFLRTHTHTHTLAKGWRTHDKILLILNCREYGVTEMTMKGLPEKKCIILKWQMLLFSALDIGCYRFFKNYISVSSTHQHI